MLRYFFELRNKLVLTIVTSISVFVVCYWYKEMLLFLVTQTHLNNDNFYFIFTDVTELFHTYIELILFLSVQITVWYLIYHTFFFLSTALYMQEFNFLNFVLKSGTFFWLFSSILATYILIPFGWSFFLSFQSQQGFYFEARISEYFKFYSSVYTLCLVYCQSFTLLFLFLNDIRRNKFYIKKYRKLYYYTFLIFSTVLTPPDLISQLFTTFLMISIYEIVLLCLIFKFSASNFNLAAS